MTTDPIRGLGVPDLHLFMALAPTGMSGPYHARTVTRLARVRRTAAAVNRALQLLATTDLDDVDDTLEAIRGDLDRAVSEGKTASDLVAWVEAVTAAGDTWESPPDRTLPTGLTDLDDMLAGGLRPGHLCVIGARPAVGKSLAASVIAANLAARGVGTLVVSLEMTAAEFVDRIVAHRADVVLDRLTRHALDDLDWQRVARLTAASSAWPLWIDDRAGLNLRQIRTRARDVTRRQGGLGVVIVDYLQLVVPADARVPRQEQVAAVSRGLKQLAREFAVPVVALAQVNRSPAARTDKRPAMSDLRESGAIEADADEIVLLHRDDDETPGEITFIVEKNRHGKTGPVQLAFAPHRARIANLSRWNPTERTA
jgi:replicative DNA helicase